MSVPNYSVCVETYDENQILWCVYSPSMLTAEVKFQITTRLRGLVPENFLADLLLFSGEKVFLHLSFDMYSLYQPDPLLLLRGRGDTGDEVKSAMGVSEFLIDL